jgi:hypothetical protein
MSAVSSTPSSTSSLSSFSASGLFHSVAHVVEQRFDLVFIL